MQTQNCNKQTNKAHNQMPFPLDSQLDFMSLSFYVGKGSGDTLSMVFTLGSCVNYACRTELGKRHPEACGWSEEVRLK